MIPITPEIIGPGIKEEYADLKSRVDFLLDAWKGHPFGNDTAYGSIVFFLSWLRQELAAERIPIPLDRSYLGTIKYLVGSGEVEGPLSVTIALQEVSAILQGRSLIKPHHFPVFISMIDDFVEEMHRTRPDVKNDMFLLELQQKRDEIEAGQLILPLEYHDAIRFDHAAILSRYIRPLPGGPLALDAHKAASRILLAFSGRRPYLATKPVMAAPHPGLPTIAGDMTIIRNRDHRPSRL